MLQQLHLIPSWKISFKVGWTSNKCFQLTFSWISDVLCASQNATVATSFSIGISIEQSLPSNKATSGLDCMGPFELIGPLLPPLTGSILGRLGIILNIQFQSCSFLEQIIIIEFLLKFLKKFCSLELRLFARYWGITDHLG